MSSYEKLIGETLPMVRQGLVTVANAYRDDAAALSSILADGDVDDSIESAVSIADAIANKSSKAALVLAALDMLRSF